MLKVYYRLVLNHEHFYIFNLDINLRCSLKNIVNFTESANVGYFISYTRIILFIKICRLSLGLKTIPIWFD